MALSWRKRCWFWAAGASKDYLEQCPATEHIKYESIGALICLTAIVAGISMFFAISITWEQADWGDALLFAFPIALVWSAFIFTVDRFVVSSMRPADDLWSRVLQALPRLLLAVIIGVIISRPIELKIFEKEIRKYLNEESATRAMQLNVARRDDLLTIDAEASAQHKMELENIKNRLLSLNERIANLELEVKRLREAKNYWAQEAAKELDGAGGSLRAGPGPFFKEKKQNEKSYSDELSKTEKALNALNKEKDDIIAESNRVDATVSATREAMLGNIKEKQKVMVDRSIEMMDRGFYDYNRALWQIGNMWAMTIGIMLFFVLIEATPVLMKLLVPPGPYDVHLRTEVLREEADQLNFIEAEKRNRKSFLAQYEAAHKSIYARVFESVRRDFDNLAKGRPAAIRTSIWDQLDRWVKSALERLDAFAKSLPSEAFRVAPSGSTGMADTPHERIDPPLPSNVYRAALLCVVIAFTFVSACTFALYSVGVSLEEASKISGGVYGAFVGPFLLFFLNKADRHER